MKLARQVIDPMVTDKVSDSYALGGAVGAMAYLGPFNPPEVAEGSGTPPRQRAPPQALLANGER